MPTIARETHELRYTYSGWGFYAKSKSHVVNKETEKSLCGRKANDWPKMDDLSGLKPECERCRASMRKGKP